MFTLPDLADVLQRVAATHTIMAQVTHYTEDSEPLALIRHDVDASPQAALPVAALEQSLGVTAFYCFQVTSPFYGLSNDTVTVMRRIESMGHVIALHYDPGAILTLKQQLGVINEVTRVKAYSIHSPTRHWNFIDSAAAATNLATLGLEYWSDSLMKPRRNIGDVLAKPNIHLLFHPEHWVTPASGYRQSFREAWYRQRCVVDRAADEFLAGCSESLQQREHLDDAVREAMTR